MYSYFTPNRQGECLRLYFRHCHETLPGIWPDFNKQTTNQPPVSFTVVRLARGRFCASIARRLNPVGESQVFIRCACGDEGDAARTLMTRGL